MLIEPVSIHAQKIREGKIELGNFFSKILREIKRIQEEYNPFITIVEKSRIENEKGKLAGIIVSVKDNICTEGIRTTAGSLILQNYIPPFDATVVERVKKEGGVIIGKTCMDEFGFGTFSVNCAYGIPKNPYDKERSCGGSSGGAACIAALADFPHIAIAESTGGSISCPAAFCGVVGITPTYGRVSRWGLIDYANSLDKIGVIGKCVEDVALGLSIIGGYDEKDSTSLNIPEEDFMRYLNENIEKVKIAIPKEYFENVDDEIKERVWDGIKKLEGEGAVYEEVSLPTTKYVIPTYYIIAVSEASTNLAKFCGIRYGLHLPLEGNFNEYFSKVRSEGFGKEAKRRIILGTYARMAGFRDAYYLRAMKVRTKIISDFKKVFKKFDVIISPTMPVLPPKFDEIEKLKPIEVYMMDILTVGPNLAGIPMISVPCGFVKGLPVGMHIMADHLEEKKCLKVAYAFEKVKK